MNQRVRNSKSILLFIFRLSLFLSLFPEIGIIRLPSDSQPYFLIIMLIGIILNNKDDNRYSLIVIPFFVIFIISTTSLTFSFIYSLDYFTLFRSYFGYFSSFIVIFFLSRFRSYFTAQLVVPVIDFSIKFIYFGFVLNLIGLNKIVQLFVNRAEFRFDGERGLVSFYSEQSNMVTACFVLLFLLIQLHKLTLNRSFFLVSAILLSASGQAVLEIILVLFFYIISYIIYILIKQRVSRSFFKISILLTTLVFILYSVIQNSDFEFRAFQVFKGFNIDSGLYILGSDYSISWKVQGIFLAISTIIADPFNFQISSLTETNAYSRLYHAHDMVYDFVFGVSNPQFGDRVYSAFGTWIVDFGLVGLSLYLFFVIIFIKNIFRNNYYSPIAFTSILYVLYVTMIKVGLSTPTIFLVVFSTYIMSVNPRNSFS